MARRNPNSLEMTHLVTRVLKKTYPAVQVGDRRDGPGNQSSVAVTITDDHGESVTYLVNVIQSA